MKTEREVNEMAKHLSPIDLPPMAEMPLVSVLVANYNYAKYVGEAIESVLQQTYQNFEIVVCDDGSTDNSREVLQRYAAADSRVKLIAKENGGIASALNAAYRGSGGEIVCLLDADDVFLPNKIESVVGAFRNSPHAGVCHHKIRKMDAAGNVFGCPVPVVFAEGWVAVKALRGGCLVNDLPSRQESAASGMSWRRSAAELIFPVPIQLRRLVDMYLSRTAQFVTEICVIRRVLAKQRFHQENVTSSAKYTVPAVTRNMNDVAQVVDFVGRFLTERYGETVARQVRLEDNSIYSSFRVMLYILSDEEKRECVPWSCVRSMQPRRQRVLAWTLLMLPRSASRRLLQLWSGTSPWEAALVRAGRRVLRA